MQHAAKHLTARMQECIDSCLETHALCEEAIAHCLQQGGRYADAGLIRALTDCADVSRLCGDLMMRGSDFSAAMCRMCAEVCMRCADECARMGGEDDQIHACADRCRRCADMCRQLAGAAA